MVWSVETYDVLKVIVEPGANLVAKPTVANIPHSVISTTLTYIH